MELLVDSIDNLDTLVDLSLTSQVLNHRLKPFYKTMAHNVGVKKPVLDWHELIRENSKVNATKYVVTNNNNNVIWDCVSNSTLLYNAVSASDYQLIDKYFNIASVRGILAYVTNVEIVKYLMGKIEASNGDMIHLSPTFIIDGQFSHQLYQYFTGDAFRSIILKLGSIRTDIAMERIYAKALDQMLLTDTDIGKYTYDGMPPQVDSINYIMNIARTDSLLIDTSLVGPTNLKYIRNYTKFGKNPRSEMVIGLIMDGKIPSNPESLNNVLKGALNPAKHLPTNDILIRYLVTKWGVVVTNNHINMAIRRGNWVALKYLMTVVNWEGVPYSVRPYYDVVELTLEGAQLIHLVRPDLFITNKWLTFKGDIYGGITDSPDVLQYVMEVVKPSLEWWSKFRIYDIVYQDNIRTLKYLITNVPDVFQLVNETIIRNGVVTDTLSSGQVDRYHRW